MGKTIERQSDSSFARHRIIVELRNQAVGLFLKLGKQLYLFEKEKQYLDMGHLTFKSYLADVDVDISRSLAYMLKGIYKTYICDLKVQPLDLIEAGYSKLDVISPYVNKDNIDDMAY